MNKAAARRLALWINGLYLIRTDTSGFSDDVLDEEASVAISDQILIIGQDMITRSGIPEHVSQAEAVMIATTLGRRRR